MEQLRQPFQDIANKVDNAKNTVSGVVDKVKSAYNSSPLHSMLSSSPKDAVYKYDENAVKPKTPKANPVKPTGKMPSYKDGTSRVPKTGPAKLHKDEMVLPKETADKVRAGASSELSGDSKPAKEISHIITKKGMKNGKKVTIHTHVHTHPIHHPDETHVTEGNDQMADHMMEHMGEPNPGEAEANAGQSGIEAGPSAGPSMGGM